MSSEVGATSATSLCAEAAVLEDVLWGEDEEGLCAIESLVPLRLPRPNEPQVLAEAKIRRLQPEHRDGKVF